jgi:hypothetical protein
LFWAYASKTLTPFGPERAELLIASLNRENNFEGHLVYIDLREVKLNYPTGFNVLYAALN